MTTVAFVNRLPAEAEAQWLKALASAMPELAVRTLRDIDAAERDAVRVAVVANPDPADLAALPNLQWVHSTWAGVERMVAELGADAPPIVRLIDPELARAMAEAVLAWTYYLQRDMPAYAASQGERRWEPRPYRRPQEMTVGLLGLGALGAAAAGRLSEADFQVAGWSRTPKDMPGVAAHTDLSRVLKVADIVVCLTPLTAQTRGLLNAERLEQMKPGAALINFARGPIVVADDLIAALDAGHLSHAVLDVFDQEPLPAGSPLWSHPKVTVLPHISAVTDRRTASAIVAGNIRRWLAQGVLPQAVDMARGY
ncbi:glyoxylate/hydroxypyruvate reductase A [Caulobacter segnis]|uniref:2-hydroxyacid dehydrogenase n=1 Tax=Caulobacter segnis TaxID=88688 RepID=UPI00240EED2E|nr:glyoxylate/hydroxypyruvate reductase A [Caulobacter segnis]MDG2520761.1 glyoxylate/hydroxypyruvate reductase A [Caulobacter segnis]